MYSKHSSCLERLQNYDGASVQMRNLKAIAVILFSLMLGFIAATLLAGCRPAGPKEVNDSTTDTTDNMPETGPDIAVPDTDPADDVPADDMPSDDMPADDKPAEEAPADDQPAAAAPAAHQPAEDKPADDKPD